MTRFLPRCTWSGSGPSLPRRSRDGASAIGGAATHAPGMFRRAWARRCDTRDGLILLSSFSRSQLPLMTAAKAAKLCSKSLILFVGAPQGIRTPDPAILAAVQHRRICCKTLMCGSSAWIRGSGPRMTAQKGVTAAATLVLTTVTVSITFSESRSPKGRQPATPADGARAVPAGGGSSPPLPGGLGIMSAGTTTGTRGASLDWDRPARVTPAERREVSAPRLGRALRTKRSGQVAGNMA
jgi:hypothetical protein